MSLVIEYRKIEHVKLADFLAANNMVVDVVDDGFHSSVSFEATIRGWDLACWGYYAVGYGKTPNDALERLVNAIRGRTLQKNRLFWFPKLVAVPPGLVL